MSAELLREFLSSVADSKTFDFSGKAIDSKDCVDIVAQWISVKRPEKVFFNKCKITDSVAVLLADYFKRDKYVRKLSFRDNVIGVVGANAWAEVIQCNATVQSINLLGNNIGENCNSLLESFLASENCRSICGLSSHHNNISVLGLSINDSILIAASLEKNCDLASLEIIDMENDNTIERVISSLKENRTLLRLKITHFPAKKKIFKAFNKGISRANRLKSIELSFQNSFKASVDSSLLSSIFDAFISCRTLTSIRLEGLPSGLQSIVDLESSRLLQNLPGLLHFALFEHSPGPDTIDTICRGLVQSNNLRLIRLAVSTKVSVSADGYRELGDAALNRTISVPLTVRIDGEEDRVFKNVGEGGSTESKTMDAFQTEEWEVDDVLEVRVNKKHWTTCRIVAILAPDEYCVLRSSGEVISNIPSSDLRRGSNFQRAKVLAQTNQLEARSVQSSPGSSSKSRKKTIPAPEASPSSDIKKPIYSPGEIVAVRFYGDCVWYPSRVIDCNGENLVDVCMEDGTFEYQLEQHMVRRPGHFPQLSACYDAGMYERGDYVYVRVPRNGGVWARARVSVNRGNGTYDVRLEDYTDEKGIAGRFLRHYFRVGESVEARRPYSSLWEEGSVVKLERDGSHVIKFSSDSQDIRGISVRCVMATNKQSLRIEAIKFFENEIAHESVRTARRGPEGASLMKVNSIRYSLNDRVEVKQEDGSWADGRIGAHNLDGTYVIRYLDGQVTHSVPDIQIRMIAPPSPLSRQSSRVASAISDSESPGSTSRNAKLQVERSNSRQELQSEEVTTPRLQRTSSATTSAKKKTASFDFTQSSPMLSSKRIEDSPSIEYFDTSSNEWRRGLLTGRNRNGSFKIRLGDDLSFVDVTPDKVKLDSKADIVSESFFSTAVTPRTVAPVQPQQVISGTTMASPRMDNPRADPEPYVEEKLVMVFDRKSKTWRQGRFLGVEPNSSISVELVDHSAGPLTKVISVDSRDIRFLRGSNPVVDLPEKEKLFKVHDRVRAFYRGQKSSFLGKIAQVGPGECYSVLYDDGTLEDNLPERFISKLESQPGPVLPQSDMFSPLMQTNRADSAVASDSGMFLTSRIEGHTPIRSKDDYYSVPFSPAQPPPSSTNPSRRFVSSAPPSVGHFRGQTDVANRSDSHYSPEYSSNSATAQIQYRAVQLKLNPPPGSTFPDCGTCFGATHSLTVNDDTWSPILVYISDIEMQALLDNAVESNPEATNGTSRQAQYKEQSESITPGFLPVGSQVTVVPSCDYLEFGGDFPVANLLWEGKRVSKPLFMKLRLSTPKTKPFEVKLVFYVHSVAVAVVSFFVVAVQRNGRTSRPSSATIGQTSVTGDNKYQQFAEVRSPMFWSIYLITPPRPETATSGVEMLTEMATQQLPGLTIRRPDLNDQVNATFIRSVDYIQSISYSGMGESSNQVNFALKIIKIDPERNQRIVFTRIDSDSNVNIGLEIGKEGLFSCASYCPDIAVYQWILEANGLNRHLRLKLFQCTQTLCRIFDEINQSKNLCPVGILYFPACFDPFAPKTLISRLVQYQQQQQQAMAGQYDPLLAEHSTWHLTFLCDDASFQTTQDNFGHDSIEVLFNPSFLLSLYPFLKATVGILLALKAVDSRHFSLPSPFNSLGLSTHLSVDTLIMLSAFYDEQEFISRNAVLDGRSTPSSTQQLRIDELSYDQMELLAAAVQCCEASIASLQLNGGVLRGVKKVRARLDELCPQWVSSTGLRFVEIDGKGQWISSKAWTHHWRGLVDMISRTSGIVKNAVDNPDQSLAGADNGYEIDVDPEEDITQNLLTVLRIRDKNTISEVAKCLVKEGCESWDDVLQLHNFLGGEGQDNMQPVYAFLLKAGVPVIAAGKLISYLRSQQQALGGSA